MSSPGPIQRIPPVQLVQPAQPVGALDGGVLAGAAGVPSRLPDVRLLPTAAPSGEAGGTRATDTSTAVASPAGSNGGRGQPAFHPVVTTDLVELALALGLPADERATGLLAELLANGQPPTAETARAVAGMARAIGREAAPPLRPLVWLMVQGLPVTPETLALASAALSEGEPLPAPAAPAALPATALPSLARAAAAWVDRELAGLPAAARGPAQSLLALLVELAPAHNAARELLPTLARRLSRLAEALATPTEAKLVRLLPPAAASGAPAPPGRNGEHPLVPGDGPAEPVLSEAPVRARGMDLPSAGRSEETAPVLGRLPARLDDVRLLVHETLTALGAERVDRGEPARAGSVRRPELVEALSRLATGIEFAQLANAASNQPGDERATFWLPLPLPPGPGDQPPALAVTRWRETDDETAALHLRASVSLTLEHLGDLAITLDLADAHLRCQVRAPAPTVAVVEAALDELADCLAGLGYTVDVGTSVSAEPLVHSLAAPAPRRLDCRA